ncbi:MAG: hypothetical protein Kow00106_00410 [Anaerolineae bacterium]
MTVITHLGRLTVLIVLLSAMTACQAGTNAAPTTAPSPTTDALATAIAFQAQATRVPTATPWPSATVTPSPSDTATPTASPTVTPTSAVLLVSAQATPTPYPTNTPRPTQVVLQAAGSSAPAADTFDQTGELRDHYWLGRPFPRDPSNRIRDYASRNYPYGSTGGGQFQTHHGIDIQNPLGTAILAVASGWVIYAGSDSVIQFGPSTDFYGNLVVIEHDQKAPTGEPLYTLYGHMMRVDVQAGQRVEQGQKIGQVGATGVALGAHLHLEVRLGNPYDYGRTYNPDLWIRPWPTYGTLAGRITDAHGNRLYDVAITLQSDGGPSRTAYSYADDTVNPDPYYGEHFTYADLPAGEYQVLVRKNDVLRFKGTVTVEAGRTNWIDIRLN